MRIRERQQLRHGRRARRDAEHGAEQIVRFAQRALLVESAVDVLELVRDRRVLREQQRDDEKRGLS